MEFSFSLKNLFIFTFLKKMRLKEIVIHPTQNVPNDVYFYIFRMLDDKSLCNARMVCKSWDKMLLHSDHHYNNLRKFSESCRAKKKERVELEKLIRYGKALDVLHILLVVCSFLWLIMFPLRLDDIIKM